MQAVWTRREVILLAAMIDVLAPFKQMLRRSDLSRREACPENSPKWIEVLILKFEEGLTDQAIAKRMDVSDRTLRNYWMQIYDFYTVKKISDLFLRSKLVK